MRRAVLCLFAFSWGCQEYELAGVPSDADLPATVPLQEVPVPDQPDDPPPPPDQGPDDPPPPDLPDPSEHSETWTLPVEQPVDIVMFADTSGSMNDELDEMGVNIEAFTDRLIADGVDWRLMAVNGDQGCGVDGWFDETTPNWQTSFHDALLVEPDDLDEAGLETVANAASNTGPSQCNGDFLRPNALLHVIFISDEEDQSQGHNNGGTYWQQYYDAVVAAKGGQSNLVTFSAVAGPTPSGCDGADAGFGYDSAVAASGGAFLSICSNWSTQLDTLAAAATLQDTFALLNPADPLTLVIQVNGVAVPNTDWIFDTATNSVIFIANAPQPGDTIEIGYSAT